MQTPKSATAVVYGIHLTGKRLHSSSSGEWQACVAALVVNVDLCIYVSVTAAVCGLQPVLPGTA
jgi:hypothetical protein